MLRTYLTDNPGEQALASRPDGGRRLVHTLPGSLFTLPGRLLMPLMTRSRTML